MHSRTSNNEHIHRQKDYIHCTGTEKKSIFACFPTQIFIIAEFHDKAASHLQTLRGPACWLFLIICCAVQAGFCGWFIQEGPSLSEHVAHMEINFLRAFLSCPVIPMVGLALMQGLNVLMAVMSFMCTFMATKPPHQYYLARDITFSTLIYCMIWVTFIPIYMGMNERNRYTILISFNMVSNFGLVAAYYFPKCHLLLRKPELNTLEYFCTFLEGTMPANEDPQPQQAH